RSRSRPRDHRVRASDGRGRAGRGGRARLALQSCGKTKEHCYGFPNRGPGVCLCCGLAGLDLGPGERATGARQLVFTLSPRMRRAAGVAPNCYWDQNVHSMERRLTMRVVRHVTLAALVAVAFGAM